MSTYSTMFMVGMDSTTIPLQNVVASLGMVEIDTTKIYEDKYKNLSFYTNNQMPLSRNVNLDKMLACHEGHTGSTDCNVGQAGSVNYH